MRDQDIQRAKQHSQQTSSGEVPEYIPSEDDQMQDVSIDAEMPDKQMSLRKGCAGALIALLLLFVVSIALNNYFAPDYEDTSYEAYAPDIRMDLSPVFETEADWESGLERLEVLVSDLERIRDENWDDSDVFLKMLRKREHVLKLMDKLELYAHILQDTNLESDEAADRVAQFQRKKAEIDGRMTFIDEEATSLKLTTLRKWQDLPAFSPYRSDLAFWTTYNDYDFDGQREGIAAEASLIMDLPESFYEAYMYHTDIETKELEYEDFIDSDREVRKEAFDKLYEKNKVGAHLLAAALEGQVLNNLFAAKLYDYEDAFSAALDEDGIESDAYMTFEASLKEGMDLLHRWKAIQRKLVGIEDQLQFSDMFLPYEQESFILSGGISFSDASALIEEADRRFGLDYTEAYSALLHAQTMDVKPRDDKVDGAYTWGLYESAPYVLLNYYGDFEDLMTLAHESGHAVHYQLARVAQSYSDYDPSVLVSEMVATTNEAVLFEWLLAHPEAMPSERREAILVEYAKSIENTIFVQLMVSEFQQKIHEQAREGIHLDADHLSALWLELTQAYYGSAYLVDDLDGLGWTDMQHLYWGFYVQKYAMGYTAGIANALRIQSDETFKDQYLQVLKDGNTKTGSEQLIALGYGPAAEDAVPIMLNRFEEVLNEIENTLKK